MIGILLFILPLDATMLNYIHPTYEIKTTSSGVYKIEVTLKETADEKENFQKIREKVLLEESSKDPLMAMAFVLKLASEGDSQARDIITLYHAYKSFLKNHEKKQLLDSAKKIIHDKNADPLTREFANYIFFLLVGGRSDPSLENARRLLNQLIPGIEQTLTMKLPQKLYDEQEVKVSEMKSPYNAFPDIIQYKGSYYVAFREGNQHVGYEDRGKIRILKGNFCSKTKRWSWQNEALLSSDEYDLRDPKFFMTQHKLQIMVGGSKIDAQDKTIDMIPHVAILNQDQWTLLKVVIESSDNHEKGQWIWRVTWNPFDHQGYAFSYGKGDSLDLMKTMDGISFKKIAEVDKKPFTNLSEATIRFKSDGSALALIRSRKNGLIGSSSQVNGYQDWTLNSIPFRIGGPDFLMTKNEILWAGTRHFLLSEDSTLEELTILARMDEKALVPALIVKSSLDNSYPGMVLEDRSMTMVYYSADSEDKSNIYIVGIKLPN